MWRGACLLICGDVETGPPVGRARSGVCNFLVVATAGSTTGRDGDSPARKSGSAGVAAAPQGVALRIVGLAEVDSACRTMYSVTVAPAAGSR